MERFSNSFQCAKAIGEREQGSGGFDFEKWRCYTAQKHYYKKKKTRFRRPT